MVANVDDGVTGWQAEEIPDSDSLFMRVHRNNLDSSGNPIPGAFRNQPTRPNIELQNRAHTDVIGEKNAEARAKFMDCYWHEFES